MTGVVTVIVVIVDKRKVVVTNVEIVLTELVDVATVCITGVVLVGRVVKVG